MADEPTNLSCTPLNSSTLMFSWNLPTSGVFTVNGYHLNLQRTDNIRKENIPVCIAFYHQHLQYLCLKPFEISGIELVGHWLVPFLLVCPVGCGHPERIRGELHVLQHREIRHVHLDHALVHRQRQRH